jgi:NAD(P) transhydrogenase subunit alpha
VALSPPAVAALIADGVEVAVQSGAGDASFISDEAFREAGAKIVPDAAAVYGDADVVVRVGRPTDEETGMMRSGAILIGTLGTLSNPELARRLAETGVTAISMDSIPRITRAQSMDTLSSQATVGGYKAVLLAAERLPKFMPLLTTAAGTVRPARGIVMGAGVAGLMAIGTARRLGAVVEATDVRPVVKEQVESLGGIFIEVEMTEEEKAGAETAGGYAREMSDDYKARQAALIAERVKEADFVITTALIPGRPAPRLVTDAMVASMKPGSVIVDMAAEMGGNVEGTEAGKEIMKHGVTIIGLTNLPATMPGSASAMYAKNMQTLLKHLIKDGSINLDFTDEITRGATITHGGKVINEATAKALGIEVAEPPTAAPAAPAAPAPSGGAA